MTAQPTKAGRKRVHAFRHGETEWNAAMRMQGHTDIPLNDVGRRQAAELGAFFAQGGPPIGAVLTSDLARALETARTVANATGLPLTIEPRLRETALGQAEGLTFDEIVGRFGAETWARWRSLEPSDHGFSFPGGESKAAALARALSGLEDRALASPATELAVCTHGGILRRLIHWLKPELVEPIVIPNCRVFAFDFDPGTRVWTPLF